MYGQGGIVFRLSSTIRNFIPKRNYPNIDWIAKMLNFITE